MQQSHGVCLLNDSFPPLIDGVSNVVLSYARCLPAHGFSPMVVTPEHPQAEDGGYPYPVIRYPSIQSQRFEGYPAGIPFSPEASRVAEDRSVSLLHSHCPVMSTFMARQLREIVDAPIVFTYHTKFDVDIAAITKNRALQLASKRALAANISSCDEIWVVSHGAGENMRALGVDRDYLVMPNGVDFSRGRADAQTVARATAGYDLPAGVPVYLFVGRMMWYKGLGLILDALHELAQAGREFRMVFIGGGADRQEVEARAETLGLRSRCFFTGPVRERELLRGWYTRADLFLFPSTFDTNGLVVREAAACDLPSVLLRGSCAAEGVTDGRCGFLIDESAESLARCLASLTPEQMARAGRLAGEELYLSWEHAVDQAAARYEIVLENYRRGEYRRHHTPMDGVLRLNGDLMNVLGDLSRHLHQEEV